MIHKQIVCGSADLSSDFTCADTQARLGPVIEYVLELTGKVRPKLCFVGTASGDSPIWIAKFYDACSGKNIEPSHLQLFKSPNHHDIKKYLLSQDVIWVEGGSTENMLAVWNVHEVYQIMREAYEKGVILAGYSAGAVCWGTGGTTDSFGSTPRPFSNSSGLLPFSIGVHNDTEKLRMPLFKELIHNGNIPEGFVTDEGVSIHFIDSQPVKIISDAPGKAAYFVHNNEDNQLLEIRIEPELLK